MRPGADPRHRSVPESISSLSSSDPVRPRAVGSLWVGDGAGGGAGRTAALERPPPGAPRRRDRGVSCPIDLDRLILIVTGAHLRAEEADRPLAYRLRQTIIDRLREGSTEEEEVGRRVLVVSDLWYLNHAELRELPTISIGGPGVNALSAYLADKIPSAFAIQDVLVVQVDLDFVDLTACCWGINHSTTVSAIDAFVERYLDDFLGAATRDWA